MGDFDYGSSNEKLYHSTSLNSMPQQDKKVKFHHVKSLNSLPLSEFTVFSLNSLLLSLISLS